MSDKLLKLAHAAQVCRDHLDKWEREKVKFSETIQGLLVRVLIEEGESRHYIVGMVDGLRRANQPYKFGNLTPSEHALLLDTHGHSSSFLMNTVSNTLIGQGELDQWIQTKGYTPEEVAEKLQQRISAFQYLKKYGQQDPARADRATHAINPENILMEGGETFDEDLCCTCCYELPLRPLRCKEDHILCESCFRESKRGSQPMEVQCPHCNQMRTFDPAGKLWRKPLEKLNAKARCQYHKKGCTKTWDLPITSEKEILDFHAHMESCEFEDAGEERGGQETKVAGGAPPPGGPPPAAGGASRPSRPKK